ncbi:MAG TPA: ABC transporter substrate-binding protein, partial [Xanthobacteraceae bacterium]
MSSFLRRISPFVIVAGLALATGVGPASAQTCPAMRKINVGVSVSPPNVVHTTAYVAKELGIFAAHCIDANIIQFDGGTSPAATVALTQGTFTSVSDVQVGRGMKVKQVWGLAPKAPQAYVVSESV